MSKNVLQRRLRKELASMHTDSPPGIRLHPTTVSSGALTHWEVEVDGAEGTLYEGEHYLLDLKFNARYPFESPSVMFVGSSIPVHPHIYSNGHICLNILTDDWSPALTALSICISILSMLSSCTEKKKPADDSTYMLFAPKDPKKTQWVYEDDNI
ncbi:ubiquitin-conjugating enzyme E2 W-like [Sycon ciliatum]|uniref:ubiquitin-conjugating enzyme E2 W-like n=1 Tax=Sycon ciliatum TaxID=27933 RepID=UPI0020A86DB1|eukprot:scpid67382/ scgid10859/ Ubiquitin-conjugating enzyme E2 W; Ubiquitin carrier protein W; Ubiquitin-conjugating enzyme 16; Ubiquitin-protein ligase W &gt; Ubiquitin-conjugating enzyme E2 W; Ubiquitin carrier protein W; Ubiquitin-protein ligase W &gt; Ubiquitin-conjugating enzyme E2 W; Ubiquitin carrier protein W; Ubiquitin-protein ligase W